MKVETLYFISFTSFLPPFITSFSQLNFGQLLHELNNVDTKHKIRFYEKIKKRILLTNYGIYFNHIYIYIIQVVETFFLARLLLSILTPLFLPSLSVFSSYFILAIPMRQCLGKHSCMSSPFPIAILKGTVNLHI